MRTIIILKIVDVAGEVIAGIITYYLIKRLDKDSDGN